MSLAEDRQRFELIPERAKVVRSIFEDAASGVGMYRIAQRLNKSKIPTFNPSNGWHQSYVTKILANRAALGEFQAHKRVDGKHIPDGDVIKDYFPPVIETELFYRAQDGKAQRRVNGKGRKGVAYTNIFSGLVKCAYCNSTVKFENKGAGPKGGTYLICENSKRRLGCEALRWRYKDFEASFLTFVEELDLDSIVNTSDDAAARKAIEDERSTLNGELDEKKLAMEATYKSIVAGGPPEFLNKKLTALATRLEELKALLEANSERGTEFETRHSRLATSREEVLELVGRLQAETGESTFKIRAQIASRLKLFVTTILVAPLGSRPKTMENAQKLEALTPGGEATDVIAYLRKKNKGRYRRYHCRRPNLGLAKRQTN